MTRGFRDRRNAYDPLRTAALVLQHGRPYTRHEVHDGPDYFFALHPYGVRWGQLFLEVTGNGSLVLYRDRRWTLPAVWSPLYDSAGYTSRPHEPLVVDLYERVLELHGKRPWWHRLPGSGTLVSRQERIAQLAEHYNPAVTGL